MKKQLQTNRGFLELVSTLNQEERCLLLLINQQSKSRKVLRFEGVIDVEIADFESFAHRMKISKPKKLGVVASGLLSKAVNISTSDGDLCFIPIVQKFRVDGTTGSLGICFNPHIVAALSEIDEMPIIDATYDDDIA